MWKSPDSVKGVKSWPEDTKPRDVALWASKEFPTLLLLVVAAAERKDATQLDEHCKKIREVATRIDGYRRMKVRHWREGEEKQHADQHSD